MLAFLFAIYITLYIVQTFTKAIPPYDLNTYEHKDIAVKRYNVTFKQRLGKIFIEFLLFIIFLFLYSIFFYFFIYLLFLH